MAFNWHKWKLWTFIVLLPAVALAIANHGVFPDAFALLLVLLCVTVGVSQWMASYRGIPDEEMARRRKIIEYGLALTLFANLAYHAYFARGVSERDQGIREQRVEEDREQARLDAENKRNLAEKAADAALRKAEAEKALADKKREDAEAGKLYQFRRAGGQLVSTARRQNTPAFPSPTLVPTAEISAPVAVARTGIAKVETVAEFRKRHSFWLFIFGILETAIAVIGGAYFLTKLHEDADHNGLPDWMDRALASGRTTMDELRAEYSRRFRRAFPDGSASLPAQPIRGNFDARPNAQTVRASRPKVSARNRPHADSQKPSGELSGKPVRQGNHWIVLGVTLPDVPGVRYEGKPKRGVVNVVPTDGGAHGYVANLGKRELARLAGMSEPERFAIVADKIEAARARASERAFELKERS